MTYLNVFKNDHALKKFECNSTPLNSTDAVVVDKALGFNQEDLSSIPILVLNCCDYIKQSGLNNISSTRFFTVYDLDAWLKRRQTQQQL